MLGPQRQRPPPHPAGSHLPVRCSSGPLCFSGLLWAAPPSRAPGIFLFSCSSARQRGGLETTGCSGSRSGRATVSPWDRDPDTAPAVLPPSPTPGASLHRSTHLRRDVFRGLDSDRGIPLSRRQDRDLIQELVDAGHEVSPVLGFVGNVMENLPGGDTLLRGRSPPRAS